MYVRQIGSDILQKIKNKQMKSIKLFVLPALFIAVGAIAQNNSFLIKGKIGLLNSPAKAYLMYRDGDNMKYDSSYVNNGVFEFKGSVIAPVEAYLRINHDGKPHDPIYRPKYDVIAFMIENETIQFTSNDSIARATLTGSILNDENIKVTAQLKPLIEKYNGLNTKYSSQPTEKKNSKEFIQGLDDEAAAITKEITDIRLNYADTHPDSYLSIMLISSTMKNGFDAINAEKIYNKLSASIKETPLAKTVINRILETKRTQLGIEASDFTQNDVNGKPIKLSDFKGKYVLLDFWASWCAPCRRENPNVKEAYSKYKNQGFEILGVSLDKENAKAAWIKAIADDQMTWKQVSDLKGWSNEVAMLYSVKAIPTNFLIDPQGKIIAKDLRGQSLQIKLKEIFKY